MTSTSGASDLSPTTAETQEASDDRGGGKSNTPTETSGRRARVDSPPQTGAKDVTAVPVSADWSVDDAVPDLEGDRSEDGRDDDNPWASWKQKGDDVLDGTGGPVEPNDSSVADALFSASDAPDATTDAMCWTDEPPRWNDDDVMSSTPVRLHDESMHRSPTSEMERMGAVAAVNGSAATDQFVATEPARSTLPRALSSRRPVREAGPSLSTRRPSKRKFSSTVDLAGADGTVNGGSILRRAAHNVVEKRYRVNLNDKLTALRDSVPSLRMETPPTTTAGHHPSDRVRGTDPSASTSTTTTTATTLRKAQILTKAIEYIAQLEGQVKTLSDENASLKTRLQAFKKLALTSSEAPLEPRGERSGVRPPSEETLPSPATPDTEVPMGPQGMIRVPEDMRRLRANLGQSHYAVHHRRTSRGDVSEEMATRDGTKATADDGGIMQQLMVGHLAGLL